MAYKREELDYIAAQILPVVLEKLGVESQGISEVEVVSDLTGVNSLPAYKKVGGVEKVVEAPIQLLQEVALDAVKDATDAANGAADKANAAATNADNSRKQIEKNESARQSNENKRVEAEKGRASAETSRVNAEKGRVSEFSTLKKNAETATANADKQAGRAKAQADNPPKMGDNGNWWKWDEAQGKYVDTGVLAKGGVLYPTFGINPDTMELEMYYQDEIVADMFTIENGNLMFNPK